MARSGIKRRRRPHAPPRIPRSLARSLYSHSSPLSGVPTRDRLPLFANGPICVDSISRLRGLVPPPASRLPSPPRCLPIVCSLWGLQPRRCLTSHPAPIEKRTPNYHPGLLVGGALSASPRQSKSRCNLDDLSCTSRTTSFRRARRGADLQTLSEEDFAASFPPKRCFALDPRSVLVRSYWRPGSRKERS